VLGLEVVTPDGEIWNGLRGLRKDNTGYDLKQLYIGAEGTLGIITAAVLKLFPRHRQVETAFVAVPNPRAVLDLLTLAREVSGDGGVLAFEMIPQFALDLVVKHVAGATDPLATPSSWYVLADLTVARATAEAFMAQALQHGLVSDGALAGSAAQAAALWKLRESISEAQKREGGSIKNDISVPVSEIPSFIEEALAAVAKLVPAFGPCPSATWATATCTSTSANPWAWSRRRTSPLGASDPRGARHRGGPRRIDQRGTRHRRGQAREARRYKSAVEIDLMRRIKQALDPKGIMNLAGNRVSHCC